MVLIPEDLYERLLKKECSPVFSENLKHTPLTNLNKQMTELKKNKKMSSLEKNLKYNQVHKRINKIFMEKAAPVQNIPFPKVKVSESSSATQTEPRVEVAKNSFAAPIVENKKQILNKIPANKKYDNTTEINFLDAYAPPFKKNSDEKLLFDFIKNKGDTYSFNEKFEVLKDDGNMVKGSNIKDILEYYFANKVWKDKYRKPNGYEILINKLINNDYINTNYLNQKGEGKHKFCFKPLLW